jgi:phosphoglycerate dehydrogenase-like enzyme
LTKIAVMIPPGLRAALFPEEALARLNDLGEVRLFEEEKRLMGEDARAFLGDAEVCIGSWGMPRMDEEVLSAAPNLRLIVYAAGSVKPFVTDAVWERGVRVTSGAPAIAVGVAELVVGLAVLARRDAFRLNAAMRNDARPQGNVRELWNSTVGLVSLGQVGRLTAQYLRPFGVKLLAYDPYVSEEAMAAVGAEKASLEELLRRSDVVSLHSPNLPETRHLIRGEQLRLMRDDAILINTSRGAVIKEDDLIEELRKGRLFACLDVTDPEPAAPDSPLRSLPNVFLTPHIAGPRTKRLGLQAVEETERYLSGRPQAYEIARDRLPFTA